MFERRSFYEEVSNLKQSFDRANWKAMTTMGFDNSKGTKLYDFQVEYCYLMNSIERDSSFVAKKMIPRVKELIEELRKESSKTDET